MPSGNKTQREIEGRIQAFRKRTGLDYGCVWISPERFLLLPQAIREAAMKGAMLRGGCAHLVLDGVPVRVLQTIAPVGR